MTAPTWPAPTLGRLIALLVLLAVLAAAFVSGVKVENLDLWLAGALAVAFLVG